MYQQDWLMRQIQTLIQFIAKAVFQQDAIHYEIEDYEHLTQADMLYIQLKGLLENREICAAENLLFEKMDLGDPLFLTLAADFYRQLNLLRDEELIAAHFSREEIQEGLQSVIKAFGLPESLML